MIELQTALLLAGVVVFVVVLVISYDKYRLFKRRERDALIDEGEAAAWRDEPSLVPHSELRVEYDDSPADTEASRESDYRDEPLVPAEPVTAPERTWQADGESGTELAEEFDTEDQWEHAAPGEPEAVTAPESQSGGLQFEFVARVPGKNVIKRDTALGLYRQYDFDLNKPHRIFGLRHPDKKWCDLENEPDSASFTDFGMTLQLSDRDGPVTESDLNQFSQLVLRFAEIFGRRFKFSSTFEEALEQGKALDAFCKKYDSLAILNVVARDVGFRGRDIEQHALDLGMSLNRRRYYDKLDPAKPHNGVLYSLANLSGNGQFDDTDRLLTNGLTLFMSIPRTRNPAHVFAEMVDDAKALCERLGGKLVDQNQRGMTQKGLKHISQQIREISAEMERQGMVPGSELSKRLF